MRYVTPALRVTECPRPRPVRRKVANIKCELLNDFASANRARRAAVLADDAALELDIDATRGEDASGACAAAAPPQDDDFEELTVDAEFERLVGGDACRRAHLRRAYERRAVLARTVQGAVLGDGGYRKSGFTP